MSASEVLNAAASELEASRAVALCAIVATRGSVPQPAGTMVCVNEGFQMTGTIGGGCVEAEIRNQAFAQLSSRPFEESSNRDRGGPGKLLTLRLDHDFGFDDGMICGGELDVAVSVWQGTEHARVMRAACQALGVGEGTVLPMRVGSAAGQVEYRVHVESTPDLIIAGGGHIGRLVAHFALPLGFAVTVIDDRREFANEERFPPPIHPVVGDIGTTLSGLAMGSSTYIVIVTRGHRHDEQALASVLKSKAKYIGLIGSRRKVLVIFDDLRHAGATEDQLARVHAPIGVKIGAVTTEEIALSIAAELVSVRRAERCQSIEGPFPLRSEQT